MIIADDDGFEIIERRRVHDGFIKLDIYRVRQALFQGGMTPPLEREVVVNRSAVAVICYDPRLDSVILVQQLRLPALIAGLPALQTEVPAGLTDPGELPEAVARREVLEETGLAILGDPILIAHMASSPGFSTETVHVYCARVDAHAAATYHGVAAEHEDLRLLILPFAEFAAWMSAGRISNAFTLLAGFWLVNRRDGIREAWAAEPQAGENP